MKTRTTSSSLFSFPLLSLSLYLSFITRSDSALSSDLLGVSPHDEVYYKALWSSPSATIKCKDGLKEFSKSQLNDDFCDCPDASDEPGTSACPNGRFYCRNAGHVPLTIYSSRVNDGICDCCDGSDEYDGKTKCSNTCWEAGKAARDKLKKKIAIYKEGVVLRKKEVEQAKVAVVKDEAELLKLKNEEKILKGLVQQLKEQKELIEKAEEKERLQKEKEEKAKKEAEDAKTEKSDGLKEPESQEKPVEDVADDKTGLVEDPILDQDGNEHPSDSLEEVEHVKDISNEVPKIEVQEDAAAEEPESPIPQESNSDAENKENDVSEDTSSLTKEELGRLIASRWTGEETGKQATEAAEAVTKDNDETSVESPKDAESEQYEEYDSEIEDDRYDNDDDEEEEEEREEQEEKDDHVEDLQEENHDDFSTSYQSATEDDLDSSDEPTTELSWMEKIQQSVRNILRAVNPFQPRVNLSEAARVRKEYDESNARLSKIQSRISSLTKKLEQDFGPEKEFFSFYKKCFEMKQNKYTYKVCPFKEAIQEEGYSKTRLGNWEKFEDSYRVMVFSSGDKCWNGPDRSLKVKLRCGLMNEVTDVDEPSRCEYVALLATPALCAEEKLKELEDKLEMMNKKQPQGHDEL